MVKVTSKTRVVNASFLDGLGRAARQTFLDSVLRPVRHSVDDLFHHVFRRAIGYGIAGLLLGAGVILAILSAVEALRSVPLPGSIATAIVAAVSLLGGLVLARSMKSGKDA